MCELASDLVWYASYGSNCDASRFALYLEGGVRDGTAGRHRGARDPSLPRESSAMEFPSQITFSGQSRRWGRGVAFLEHRHAPAGTPGALGRRYLITRQQFEDVFAQENARPTAPIDFGSATCDHPFPIAEGWYGALVALEPLDGVPVLTFTSQDPPEHKIPRPPSIEYLLTIATGLAQTHDLDMHVIVDRLRIPKVIAGEWSREDLYSAFSNI